MGPVLTPLFQVVAVGGVIGKVGIMLFSRVITIEGLIGKVGTMLFS